MMVQAKLLIGAGKTDMAIIAFDRLMKHEHPENLPIPTRVKLIQDRFHTLDPWINA